MVMVGCQSMLFVYLLFDSEAELNALKDSISYLKASDKDCYRGFNFELNFQLINSS